MTATDVAIALGATSVALQALRTLMNFRDRRDNRGAVRLVDAGSHLKVQKR